MKNIIETFVLNQLLKNNKEEFAVDQTSRLRDIAFYQLLAKLVALVVVNLLVLLFGKFLWNNYLVKVVSGVKPIESIWHLLAISILLKMLF